MLPEKSAALLYSADYEHHTGRALGRVHEICQPSRPTVTTGQFCWRAWRRTGRTLGGVVDNRYDAEDRMEDAMEQLA